MNTGQTLAHFEMIRTLGKGGMGEAYLAQDTTLDRQFATKALPASVREDSSVLHAFGGKPKPPNADSTNEGRRIH